MITDDHQILALWFSPNFPTGGFAYSHGIDNLIAEGRLRTVGDLEQLLGVLLADGGGKSDAIYLARAYDGADVMQHCLAFAAGAERLEETRAQGHAFAKAVAVTHGIEIEAAPYPIAIGQAASQMRLDKGLALQFYLQAFLSNIAMIAQRLVPFSALDVNAVLARLHSQVRAIALEANGAGLDDIHSNLFALDVASMRHETQGVRLCKT